MQLLEQQNDVLSKENQQLQQLVAFAFSLLPDNNWNSNHSQSDESISSDEQSSTGSSSVEDVVKMAAAQALTALNSFADVSTPLERNIGKSKLHLRNRDTDTDAEEDCVQNNGVRNNRVALVKWTQPDVTLAEESQDHMDLVSGSHINLPSVAAAVTSTAEQSLDCCESEGCETTATSFEIERAIDRCANAPPCLSLKEKIIKYGCCVDLPSLCKELMEKAICRGDPWAPESWIIPDEVYDKFPLLKP